MEDGFDLAVIGGGIVGAMAAYLSNREKPDWRTVLIDRSMIGHGATQYSVGLDFPYGRTPFQKRLSSESAKLFRDLKADIPDLLIRERPLFGVVKKENAQEVIDRFTDGNIRPASQSEYEQLLDSYPDFVISSDQILLAGSRASYAFPALVAAALIDRFRESKSAHCWEGVEVQEINPTDRGIVIKTADDRRILAMRVLIATGPWLLRGPCEGFARSAGVRIKKVAALHIARCPGAHDPIVYLFDEDAFFLPVYERREWIFSFTSQEWDCEPDVSRLRISAEDRNSALAILGRYSPSLVEYCNGGRVFCDAYSLDRAPIISRISYADDLLMAGACSGSGYRLSPAIASEALRMFSGYAAS